MKALSVSIAISLASLLAAGTASANNGGLPGYSGKPTAIAPAGESCNQCHTGGTAPTVVINGPATLAAGQSAEYTLVVTTGLVRAGGGVAGSNGVVLTPIAGGGFRDSFGEMVQDAPLTVAGGSATFRFTVKAPSVGTSMKLWGVGLAANNANAQNGDRATHATRDVTITGGGVAPPDGGGGGTGDGGGGGVIEGAGGPAAEGGTGTSGGNGTGTGGGNGDGTGGGDGDGDNAADPDGTGDDGQPATYGPGRGRSVGGPAAAACAAAPFAIDGEGFAAAAGIMVLGTMMMIARRRKRA